MDFQYWYEDSARKISETLVRELGELAGNVCKGIYIDSKATSKSPPNVVSLKQHEEDRDLLLYFFLFNSKSRCPDVLYEDFKDMFTLEFNAAFARGLNA